MPRRAFMPPAHCERCGESPPVGETLHHHDIWWCATCLAKETPGRDLTTKTAFHSVAAQLNRTLAMHCKAGGAQGDAGEYERISHWQADATDLLKQAANNRARGAQCALGEVVPEQSGYLKDTLSTPDFIAMDASFERTRLLTGNGVDALALALDAANSAGATTSIEKMHLHQLAVLHKTALEQICDAKYASDPDRQIKNFQTASRLIRTFQQGLIALVRLRGGGLPIVQHVHINEGAQAFVGTVQKGTSSNPGHAPEDGH